MQKIKSSNKDGNRDAIVTAKMKVAAVAYEKDRYGDATKILNEILKINSENLDAIELLGLCHYRQGNWAQAIDVLEEFTKKSGSLNQLPVVADCFRGLGYINQVRRIYKRLASSRASKEVIAEGRIIMASALGDQERYPQAIEIFNKVPKNSKSPTESLLRQWYVLADLYEKSGDIPRARDLFAKIANYDPELADVAERAVALS
ncbi:MAG: tetratricopeptide repeat protein [Acidimicrobiales bacterium]|nr:tetratricopeptide repeat protein [Acidimicrobiales bacterium]